MIDVKQAIEIIEAHALKLGIEEVPLMDAVGRILAERFVTDRDLPPYDRITMDGIAISYSAFEKGQRKFPIAGVVAAGMGQNTLLESDTCLEVMTGSMLPKNCDTVIRYEDVQIENGLAEVMVENIRYQQNIHFKGEDRQAGELLADPGKPIYGAEINVAASIGKTNIQVVRQPRIMVISTGDELVDIDADPLPHQIRRSNVFAIAASLKHYGIQADMDHLNDEKKLIKEKIKVYLDNYDCIICSGGVSKGKFDFLPEVFNDLGVEQLFHKVAQRPGKPFWFGRYEESCCVFGLPGNPVSSFLCMQRYVLHWLDYSLKGKSSAASYAQLSEDVTFKPDLSYYLEVRLSSDALGNLIAKPQRGNGSGDLANLAKADAFMLLPKERQIFKKGEVFAIFEFH